MPRVKPAYDTDGGWKNREFNEESWKVLTVRLQKELRPYYPDKSAEEDPTFGHPADEWSNYLISASWSAISTMRWIRLRLTKEKLLAEQTDLLKTLNLVVSKLSSVSLDLDKLFGVDADVLGARDKIKELIPFVEASGATVAKLPRAKKRAEADHDAAIEMAVRVLRILRNHGIEPAATADKIYQHFSDAVSILKLIGDELQLPLDETTWRRVISQAKEKATDLQ